MERRDVERWVQGYERAWASNDPSDVGSLFTDDATYRFHPYDEPLRGREAIAAQWIENKDEPGDYQFQLLDVAGIDSNLAFVTAVTDYFTDPRRTYDNLWVIRLAPDGRCEDFTEWYMKRPEKPAG